MIHKLFATKPIYPRDVTITPDVKPLVQRGEVVLTIDTPLDLGPALAAISNGSASLEPPAVPAPSITPASPSNPA